MRSLLAFVAACLIAGPCLAAGDSQSLAASDFAWRAKLENPAGESLLRFTLPAQALLRLQTRDSSDLRIFDAQSQPVPFAFARPPQGAEPPRKATPTYAALPLYSAQGDARPPKGSVQVRVEDGAQRSSVWVQMSPALRADAPPQRAQRMPAALFDTRSQKERVSALVVKATIPLNAPIRIGLSTSSDLANWTPVYSRGRIYRFEGDGAPANDTLELPQPLQLEGRYLRLEWEGQQGVTVDAVTGLVAAAAAKPQQTVAVLSAARADGPAALEWELGFATPLAALELTTDRADTLVPVRILGRNQVSEPWRALGQTVIYRLGPSGSESVNTPAALYRPSVRWLRVEATHGMRLEGMGISARAVFDPVQIVFVAGNQGPFVLAAGRAATAVGALPLNMLLAASTRKPEELAEAKLASAQDLPAPGAGALAPWLPRGLDSKTALLWLVLGVGVLVLGGVAWSLLRQLNSSSGGQGPG